MAKITIQNRRLQVTRDETVLECLLRNNFNVPFACQKGQCQSCRVRALKGSPTPVSQQGLRETEKAQNFFLSCVCFPVDDMDIVLGDENLPLVTTRVYSIEEVNESIIRIKMECPPDYDYFAGQSINLYNDEGVFRTYCLSSVPGLDEHLELEINLVPGGQVTPWVFKTLTIGSEINISRPSGNCFYLPGDKSQPMIMVATGIALAPTRGIVRDALVKHRHTGPIVLYHETYGPNEDYLIRDLNELARQYPNLSCNDYLSAKEVSEDGMSANEAVLSTIDNLGAWRIFLCGDFNRVSGMTRDSLMSGARMNNIHMLPFTLSKS
ncbi:MAG: 2Fe-2S iron-sulfur cluster-binding protein [Pseudomonadota bacterium]